MLLPKILSRKMLSTKYRSIFASKIRPATGVKGTFQYEFLQASNVPTRWIWGVYQFPWNVYWYLYLTVQKMTTASYERKKERKKERQKESISFFRCPGYTSSVGCEARDSWLIIHIWTQTRYECTHDWFVRMVCPFISTYSAYTNSSASWGCTWLIRTCDMTSIHHATHVCTWLVQVQTLKT